MLLSLGFRTLLNIKYGRELSKIQANSSISLKQGVGGVFENFSSENKGRCEAELYDPDVFLRSTQGDTKPGEGT